MGQHLARGEERSAGEERGGFRFMHGKHLRGSAGLGGGRKSRDRDRRDGERIEIAGMREHPARRRRARADDAAGAVGRRFAGGKKKARGTGGEK